MFQGKIVHGNRDMGQFGDSLPLTVNWIGRFCKLLIFRKIVSERQSPAVVAKHFDGVFNNRL